MSLRLPSLQSAKLAGKTVLLRVDFNVPFDAKTKRITDDTRIRLTLPVIKMLQAAQAKIIIISHFGRPHGAPDKAFSLKPVASYLGKQLGTKITFIAEAIGPKALQAAHSLKNGQILMLENIRFYHEELACDPKFAKKLASLGDIFVSEAFSVCHRDQSSVTGLPHYLPSYAGPLLQKEIETLTELILQPRHPVTLIIGGAKIDTKIDVLKNFLKKADYLLIGGGLANTFLAASGYQVADSLYEPNKVETAQEIMLLAEKNQCKFILPKDVVVASEISDKSSTLALPIQDVEGDMKILDIGPMTRTRFYQIIQKSKTILWNGPVGLFEYKPFAAGTKLIARELAASEAKTIIGGGDTIDALKKFKISFKHFSHVSTGGGAMLEFLSGKKLPGIQALSKR